MTDVLVIGGGLAGCATAYYLAADGVDVTLIEKDDLNTRASGSNAGSLHAQIPYEPFVKNGPGWAATFAPTIKLLAQSIELWRGLPALLETDLDVSLKGGLLVAATEADMAALERKAEIERRQGLTVTLLDRADLRRIAPYLSQNMAGGAFCPDEGKANPFAATPAFAAAASRLGARILRHHVVTDIARDGGGYAVATNRGVFRARRIVDAAGSEAGRIAAMLGVHLPVEGHPIQVSVTEPVAPLIPHLVYYTGEKLTLKQNGVGSLLIGGGWPARIGRHGHPMIDPASLAQNLALAVAVAPSLAKIRVVRSWAAIVNGTADWKPLLGEVPGSPGFFINFVPWMGFTAGPIAARIVASLAQDRPPPVNVDLSPFKPH
jgi:glycine/D-amino acid oxidase-like deaminating enzyme